MHAVFLADVAGLYDRPTGAGAGAGTGTEAGDAVASMTDCRVIPEITVDAVSGEPAISLTTNTERADSAPDVTGGIKGKIKSACTIAQMGGVCYIVEAGTPHSLNALCGRHPEICTCVRLHDVS